MSFSRPVIALTCGDPAGIGPEIIIKSLLSGSDGFIPVIYGKREVFQSISRHALKLYEASSIDDVLSAYIAGSIPIIDPLPDMQGEFMPGEPTLDGSRLAMEAVTRAAHDALAGRVDAVVTAPIYKKGIQAAGYTCHGHTDYLAGISGTTEYAMMLTGGGLNVVLVTIHIPLTQVVNQLNQDAIVRTLRITHDGLQLFGYKAPRIALCGLNPHAGEEGMLGTEEQTILEPAVAQARHEGINVTGIFPADTVFWDALHGAADVVVALYHDQGLIPVKLLAFDSGVNCTLGLPFVRTSPDHGTAFNIAGQNRANANSFSAAIKTALKICKNRHND